MCAARMYNTVASRHGATIGFSEKPVAKLNLIPSDKDCADRHTRRVAAVLRRRAAVAMRQRVRKAK